MRILLIHNRYRQAGGEDAAFDAEARLLRSQGHDVREAVATNESAGLSGSLSLMWNAAWSSQSFDTISSLCGEFKPDLAHVHNFWMSWSPSVHAACQASGVPTVQTLHNFRLLCANGLLLRNGKPCEDCLERSPWLGARRRCYRNSALASSAVVRMITDSRRRGTWQDQVDAFITPGEHARWRFVAAGFPAGRMFVKPNVIPDLGDAPKRPSASQTVVFLGRLSPEKGIGVLLEAWRAARRPAGSRLLVAGGGEPPTMDIPDVTFTGQLDSGRVSEVLGEARAVVLPSICYETFGNTIVEGFSRGRAAIASDIGALSKLVDHGRTGLKFTPGNVAQLTAHLETLLGSGDFADMLGANARAEYCSRYSDGQNYETLARIYDFVLKRADRDSAPAMTGAGND